jgi:dTDP-4-dehydrorhamnose reductase
MTDCDYLIIGSKGLLGSEIIKTLKKKKINFCTVAKQNSDFNINLINFTKLKKFILKNNFKNIINCAAIINIDKCEKKYTDTLKVNYYLPKYLSELSIKHKFKLVHISTDQVYFNSKNRLNNERDKIFAINRYAKSKILSENVVKKNKKNLIIRTNFTGKKRTTKDISFIDWVNSHKTKKKNVINLFEDMYTSTIDVKNCARFIIKLIEQNFSGIYNLGSRYPVSKKKFALAFIKKMKIKLNYNSISCDSLPVKRCKYLGMCVNKIEKDLEEKMPTLSEIINNLSLDYK